MRVCSNAAPWYPDQHRTQEANETFYLDLIDNNSNSLLTKNRGIGTILNDDSDTGKLSSFASAVDAVIDDWLNSGRKNRSN